MFFLTLLEFKCYVAVKGTDAMQWDDYHFEETPWKSTMKIANSCITARKTPLGRWMQLIIPSVYWNLLRLQQIVNVDGRLINICSAIWDSFRCILLIFFILETPFDLKTERFSRPLISSFYWVQNRRFSNRISSTQLQKRN